MTKRLIVFGLWALLASLVLIQFVPVARTNPPVGLGMQAPPEIQAVLRTSCFDCHSNETVWPWYSHVAPISWMVIQDVQEGRAEYNLSEWDLVESKKQAEIREEMWEEASEGEMPPLLYRLAHPEARLSEEKLAVLRPWLLADIGDREEEGGRRRRRGHKD